MPASPVQLTRRAAIGTLAATGAGFALFGPRGAKERAAGGRVVLDYWEHWTGHEGDAMRVVVDEFNRSQDRILVRYFSMNLIDQKAMVAIAGGDPPDIVGLWSFNIPGYAESGALVPLDDLAAEFGVRRENYAAAVWPLLTHMGRLWGVVNTCGSIALYYNRALFREVGLDPDRPPRTIDELDEYARRLTVTDGAGRIERAGFLHMEPDWWRWHWGYFFGGSVYDAGAGGDGAGRATAASPENVRAYRWVQSYPERYSPHRINQFSSGLGVYFSPQHPFLTGRIAMTNQGPWLANVINRFKPDLDYAVAPFPVEASLYDPDRPVGLLDCDVLCIPRGARHPRESFEFVAFTQRQRWVEHLSTVHCKNSPLAAASPEFVANHPNRYVSVHSAIADSDRAFWFPRTRVWPAYVSEFDAGMQRMWNLEAPAEEVLAGIEARAQAHLDRAALRRDQRARARGEGA